MIQLTEEERSELTEAEGLVMIANAIYRLGNADAATPMGGLEALGKVIMDGDERIATSISDLADAVREVAVVLAGNGEEERLGR